MAEEQHYCEEHQVPFKKFVKGERSWYAHENGETWCNEAKKKAQPKEQIFSVEPEERATPQRESFKADPLKQASIELQTSAIMVKDLWIAGKLQDGEPEIHGLRQYIRARLCPNALQGKIEPLKPPVNPIPKADIEKALTDKGFPTVDKVNAVTLAALNALASNKENMDKIKLEVANRGWKGDKKVFTLKDLSQPQARILIGLFPDNDEPPVTDIIPF
jgi:hypothetical protein